MNKKVWGDFQTPVALAKLILTTLSVQGQQWKTMIEATCGIGNFIYAAIGLDSPPEVVVGIEIQARDSLLVVGNPAWITNAEQGVMGSDNLPPKTNFKGMRGIDALTGASNFDIAEYIWIKLLKEFSAHEVTIALICKSSVAHKVLKYTHENNLKVAASIYKIDAKRWFDVTVDSCLLVIHLNNSVQSADEIKVFESLTDPQPVSPLGFVGNELIAKLADLKTLAFLGGESPLEWRQGVKHDAAAIMEVVYENGVWRLRLWRLPTITRSLYVFSIALFLKITKDLSSRPCSTGLI